MKIGRITIEGSRFVRKYTGGQCGACQSKYQADK